MRNQFLKYWGQVKRPKAATEVESVVWKGIGPHQFFLFLWTETVHWGAFLRAVFDLKRYNTTQTFNDGALLYLVNSESYEMGSFYAV